MRLAAVLVSWVAATLLASVFGLAYIADAPQSTARAFVFAHAALVSSIAIVGAIPAIVLLLLALFVRSPRLLGWAAAACWTLLLAFVFVDTRVYALLRYHLGGLAWNLLTTGGGGDAVQVPGSSWALFALGCALCFAAALWSWPRLLHGRSTPRLARWGAFVLLGIVLLDKGLFARADLVREREVTALARCFPLYQRLTIESLAVKLFGMQLEERAHVEVGKAGLLLDYPREELRFDARAAHPNILIVVMDSLRADALGPQTMPATWAWSEGARRFENHLSGGNATRFGIFSLLYGVHGAYWPSALEENAPPVLVTSLQKLGYDMHVFSGPSLSSPEFRSTAFVSMESEVEDAFVQKEKHERDTFLGARFTQWIGSRAQRAERRPFFVFTLIDSPHQAYSFPPGAERFTPSAGEVDYLAMASHPSAEQIEAVHNRYRNAVLHADRVFAGMLAALQSSGELAHTLIVVTGDHGEEFFEHGHFGHTSNFAPEQVHVGFVLGGPGVLAGSETRPTSHVDLAPTLLELLGADPAQRAAYSSGESLLAPLASRTRVVAGWQEVGLWTAGGILRIPLEGHRGLIEAYGYDWTRLADEDALIALSSAEIAELAAQCRRFLR